METKVVGFITANATVRNFKNGMTVVNFDMALNDYFRKKDAAEPTRITTFVQCAYWNRANIAPYLVKGALVEVSGRVGTNAYLAKDGTPKAALTLTVAQIKLHSRPDENGQVNEPATITEPLEDLPF